MDPIKKSVIAIIRIRKNLINRHLSYKNNQRCLRYISELSIQISAYGNKWDSAGWRAFTIRNIEAIKYLVANNKSGESLINKIYESIEHNGDGITERS